MFESDDYDQVLSQFEFPDEPTSTDKSISFNDINISKKNDDSKPGVSRITLLEECKVQKSNNVDCFVKPTSPKSPKHLKRTIINSCFNHKSKRKFPGPAGLLTGTLEESKHESVGDIELFSQDIDYAQSHLQKHLFESPLWSRLLKDLRDWKIDDVNPIKTIKQQALDGNLRKMKAQTVTAFVEMIDRSAMDPLITLRDNSGKINCTLHRDAWSTLSQYIVSEYCALVLWKPTVLTTGSAFKKHYLNITLSNIVAVYSSTIINQELEDEKLPNNYVRICEEDLTIIKLEKGPVLDNGTSEEEPIRFEVMDDLDNLFTDDLF